MDGRMRLIGPLQLCPLSRRDVIDYLATFHSKFVITSIDKTTSNIGVVCKKFYIKNILEECGLWPGSGNETYEV